MAMPDDMLTRLWDDRPMFTITLNWTEALAIKDACSVAGMLNDGQMDGVAAYTLAHDPDTPTLDAIYDRLQEIMRPAREQLSAEIKALADTRREFLERELEED